jgi:large subunit ribosomal protein L21
MFAVIKTGGKQYRVAVGDVLKVEKIEADAGETVTFDTVLMHGGEGGMTVGSPIVSGAVVTAEIIEQFRDKKVIAFKKRRRKHSSQTRKGHRQYLTRVRIAGIPGDEDGAKGRAENEKRRAAARAAAEETLAAQNDAEPDVEAVEVLPDSNVEAGPSAPADDVPSGALPKPSNLVTGEVTDGDPLDKLPGIGDATEKALNAVGVHYFSQFTEWNAADWDFIEAYIDENVRGEITISRPSIVTQANKLIESRAAAASEE